MIQRKFRGRILSATVLAGRMIPQQNVLARERPSFKGNVLVLSKPDHGRRMNREFCRMQHMAVVLLNARDTFEDHYYGAPLCADVYGFEGGIQD